MYDIEHPQKPSHKEHDVFDIIEETERDEGVMLLQINPGNIDAFNVEKATTEVKHEMMDEEYIYMTEDLGRKEGLKEEIGEEEFKGDPKDVTKLSEYLLLTEHMASVGNMSRLKRFGKGWTRCALLRMI